MTTAQINTRNQSLQEFFCEELDQIYYPGYAQEIIDSEPLKFDFEYSEFTSSLSKPEQKKKK